MKRIYIFLTLFFLACPFIIVADEINQEEIEKLLGEAYVISGDYENAIRQYREILKKEPKNIKARIALADILSWQKKYNEAISEYEKVLEIEPHNLEIEKKVAKIYLWKEDYKKAEELFKDIIKGNPQELEAKVYLADIFSYTKEFDKAISLYREVLKQKEDPEVKKKLADVLSWDKKYQKALDSYNELLDEKDDVKMRLQKARILGWAREYDKSAKEYQKILDTSYNKDIELEMKAKLSYWNNRVQRTIRYYKELIDTNPKNLEAMFDLSQIYSYQSMWEEAIKLYNHILAISPNHFRSKEGLEKVNLISKHIFLKTGYEFFEADSSDRVNDINRHRLFNQLSLPLNSKTSLGINYNFINRSFSDFRDVSENDVKLKLSYREAPYWWASGFYELIDYTKNIDSIHTFGGGFNFRTFDIGTSSISFEREPLENSSTVIDGEYYRDNYKWRSYLDINKRLKFGLDYLYSNYSDDNYKYEPGVDILYYFSLEPRRFSIKYRYTYQEFDRKVGEYFSPQDFLTHSLQLNWRHFLNKEEIFFGADDFYYDFAYNVSVDSADIVVHKFSTGLNWDINKKLNLNIKTSFTESSTNVYKDKNITASINYHF